MTKSGQRAELSNSFKRSKQGRIESEIANDITRLLKHHGSLPSGVVDQLLTLVLSEYGMDFSMQRLEMFVRFCVESFIYTDNTEAYFEMFKKLQDGFKIRLVIYTNLPVIFESTYQQRLQFLEHLKTLRSENNQWRTNILIIELHHDLLNTDGKKSTAGDDLIVTVLDRLLYSTISSDIMPDKVDDTEAFSHLKFKIGRDLMKYYLKTNKIRQAQTLVDVLEYVNVAIAFNDS